MAVLIRAVRLSPRASVASPHTNVGYASRLAAEGPLTVFSTPLQEVLNHTRAEQPLEPVGAPHPRDHRTVDNAIGRMEDTVLVPMPQSTSGSYYTA